LLVTQFSLPNDGDSAAVRLNGTVHASVFTGGDGVDSGLYAACSGLMARTQALDIVANNLANLNTAGYKRETEFYEALTAAMQGGGKLGALNTAINQYGVLSGQSFVMSPGNLNRTGNPLDVALQGDGFFVVKGPQGMLYSRNGKFMVDQAGHLITSEGYPVLGVGGPITLPPGKASVGDDGTISVAGTMVAKLQVVQFPAKTQLQAESGSNFSAPAGAATVVATPHVREGFLEGSNVDPVSEEVNLVTLQRHSDFLTKAIKLFNTDMDGMAATDLPKVG
jgi:flagellar basal-body rod protein FlgF/flagellar basal-body rod protein FlgG